MGMIAYVLHGKESSSISRYFVPTLINFVRLPTTALQNKGQTMTRKSETPTLSCPENITRLAPRTSPYWNIIEYCRHIGLQKYPSGRCFWTARIRRKNGNYKQRRIGAVKHNGRGGLTFDQALAKANEWFGSPEIMKIASKPYAIGVNTQLNYTKSNERFTIGDAMHGLIEWKRIAAARTTFESNLSLINHHIIPRLADVPVEEFSRSKFTQFCLDVLESAPKRGNQVQGSRMNLKDLDHEALRKRKKTLNTLICFLRRGIEMAWENGDVESERSWRKLRRVPHLDTPRQIFLTRSQAKRLIASCRPDLALLVQAALYTGCRVSELASMKARDVGGNVYGVYVAPMKSYRGRYVILPDEGMSFFLDQIEALDEEDLVFGMSTGRSWKGSHKHIFKEAVRLAGLPEEFVFHGLRHTYASQLVQAGTPLAIVARQLGHSNTDTVSRTYGHLCCDSIEIELSKRFAPLQKPRNDPRLRDLRDSLQNRDEPSWSWPSKNFSKAGGTVVELLRAKEEELRHDG